MANYSPCKYWEIRRKRLNSDNEENEEPPDKSLNVSSSGSTTEFDICSPENVILESDETCNDSAFLNKYKTVYLLIFKIYLLLIFPCKKKMCVFNLLYETNHDFIHDHEDSSKKTSTL